MLQIEASAREEHEKAIGIFVDCVTYECDPTSESN